MNENLKSLEDTIEKTIASKPSVEKHVEEKRPHMYSANDKSGEIRKKIIELFGTIKRRIVRVETPPIETPPLEGRQSNQLIMEVLEETRGTQVQLPVDVLESYFGIGPYEEKTIKITEIIGEKELPQIDRPFIHLSHNKTHRLEMAGIKGLERPLIVVFTKDSEHESTYWCEIIPRDSVRFQEYSELLSTKGKQRRADSKRYLIE